MSLRASAQEIVSTQGDSYTNVSGSLDFTVGEVVIDTGTDGVYSLTQGFHQPIWKFVGIEDIVASYEASVYPNPTEDVLFIKANDFENVTCYLYDAQGRLVVESSLISEQTAIQVSHLAKGSYFLNLNQESQILKTFKLVKSE